MELMELKEKQREAFKRKDYQELSEINKQIYAIRDAERKAKRREIMLRSFNRIHEKIEEKIRGEL